MVCLKVGGIIPPYKMEYDTIFYIIEGKGDIMVDKEKEYLSPGICIVMHEESETRSISAKKNMIILADRTR